MNLPDTLGYLMLQAGAGTELIVEHTVASAVDIENTAKGTIRIPAGQVYRTHLHPDRGGVDTLTVGEGDTLRIVAVRR